MVCTERVCRELGRYHEVVIGDTWILLCLIEGISFPALQSLSTYLSIDCLNLWLKSSECIGEVTHQQPVSMDGNYVLVNGNTTCIGSESG